MRTVEIDTAGINIVKAPDPEVFYVVFEVGTCDEVQRFVLLSGDDGKVQQVRTANDVALKFNVIRKVVFDPVVNFVASDSDLFFCFRVNHVPRTDERVLRLCDSVRSIPRPHQIDITKFVSSMDQAWYGLFFHAEFQRISWLADSERVQKRLNLRNCPLSDVHLSEFSRIDI